MPVQLRFATTRDEAKLAWAQSGRGPRTLLRLPPLVTDIRREEDSPVFAAMLDFFAPHARIVRYDQRGNGSSTRRLVRDSLARRLADLETVIDAAGIDGPSVVLAASHSVPLALALAVRQPQRVSHLVLLGGQLAGSSHQEDAERRRAYAAAAVLVRSGWDRPNAGVRDLILRPLAPSATPAEAAALDRLTREAVDPEAMAVIMRANFQLDVRPLLSRVRAPTLVLHARHDALVDVASGHALAAGIPGAVFAELDGADHILLPQRKAWRQFTEQVSAFLGFNDGEPGLGGLTRRESGILAELCAGRSNAQIAGRLGLSEKTVRNHVSHILAKRGAASRSALIAAALTR